MSSPEPVDADQVVRRVAEQAASALAEQWVRVAVLETQLAAVRNPVPEAE